MCVCVRRCPTGEGGGGEPGVPVRTHYPLSHAARREHIRALEHEQRVASALLCPHVLAQRTVHHSEVGSLRDAAPPIGREGRRSGGDAVDVGHARVALALAPGLVGLGNGGLGLEPRPVSCWPQLLCTLAETGLEVRLGLCGEILCGSRGAIL